MTRGQPRRAGRPAAAPVARRARPLAPFVALLALLALGAAVNPNFLSAENLLNVLTRSAFVAVIGVGATFVIAAGGLDLSVGSMAAFVAGTMILFLNAGYRRRRAPARWRWPPALALGVGTLCGLGNGLVTTLGRIEPFIVTLGTMGIFRGLTVWLAAGGSIAIKSQALRAAYRPAYFGTVAGVPVPILVTLAAAALGAFVIRRTAFGRHVEARRVERGGRPLFRHPGRRASAPPPTPSRASAWRVAVLVYVPRLGAATATTGLLWELEAITAVVIGGTALRGGIGRVWGTVCGALILEVVGNIMVLSSFVSEYLIGAVQGAIIIVAMLLQRTLLRRGRGR